MKFKLPLIAVMVGALSLTACGGGSDSPAPVAVSNPASLTINDVTLGTGTVVAKGTSATITYTVYLYSATATDFKGTQLETGPFTFTVGSGGVIAGVDAGIVGMKVGGRRILLIPSSQAYGSAGQGSIPPNAGLVFDMTLTAAK